jgi:hypothetical protein
MTMPMNNIPSAENEEPQIRLLRARRWIFANGERLLWIQLILTVGVPVIGSLLSLKWPEAQGIVAFASLSIAVLDVTLFDRLQQEIRLTTAKTQEQFDCAVLDLPWNTFAVGSKVDPETIHDASKKYNKGRPDSELVDWYPTVVGNVPLHLARIICQRTNLWYDSKLRRRFGGWALTITVSLSLLLTAFGIARKVSLDSFVLTVMAPIAPILIWGVREYFRQRDAAGALESLKLEAESLWERAKAGQCTDAECTIESRQFQNAIYEMLRRNPTIFGWIYKHLRESLEDQMKHGADEFVNQLK